MTYEIRPPDAPLLNAAATRFGRGTATGARFLAQPASVAFVAVDGGEVVGWVWGLREIRPDGRDQVLLYELDTAGSHRRQGIGAALVRAVIDLAAAEGFGRVWLVTNKDNAAAVGLYESLGGRACGDDDVVYRWDLG